MKLEEKLKELETDDYQGRRGSYPKANVADDIRVNDKTVTCEFKNTTEESARKWLKNFLEGKGFVIKGKVESYQSGDYHDDWVTAYATVEKMSK